MRVRASAIESAFTVCARPPDENPGLFYTPNSSEKIYLFSFFLTKNVGWKSLKKEPEDAGEPGK